MAEQLFLHTGDVQTFVVPPHITGTLRATLRGGRGRRTRWVSGTEGGPGGRISGVLDLSALALGFGSVIHVIVGDGAESADGAGDGAVGVGEAGLGPFLGGEGGDGIHGGSGGGAASELRANGSEIANRIMVAGGGGGGGDGTVGLGTDCSGGAGGLGVAAGSSNVAGADIAGEGGSLVGAGAGGPSLVWGTPPGAIDGTAGVDGTGGDAGYVGFDAENLFGGSGGGGGYFGGGGGGARAIGSAVVERGPGGGGSSWAAEGVTDITFANVNPDGWAGSFVLFEWEPCDTPPTASFTATPTVGPAPLTVDFDGSASSAQGAATVVDWEVNYGDSFAGVSNSPLFSHTYTDPGTYTAELWVEDSNGCFSEPVEILITVLGEPTILTPLDADCTLEQGYLYLDLDSGFPAIGATPGISGASASMSWTSVEVPGGVRFTVEVTALDPVVGDYIAFAGVTITEAVYPTVPPASTGDYSTQDISIDATVGITLTPEVSPVPNIALYSVSGGVINPGDGFTLSFTTLTTYEVHVGLMLLEVIEISETPGFFDVVDGTVTEGIAWIGAPCDVCPPGSEPILTGTLVTDPVVIVGPSGDNVILQMIGNASDITLPQGEGFIADGSLYPVQPSF